MRGKTSHHVKHPLKNLPKKVCSPMQSFLIKKVPSYFAGGEESLCFIFKSFLISKSLSLWNKLWPFKQNYLATVFKVIQYGFGIFQTVKS